MILITSTMELMLIYYQKYFLSFQFHYILINWIYNSQGFIIIKNFLNLISVIILFDKFLITNQFIKFSMVENFRPSIFVFINEFKSNLLIMKKFWKLDLDKVKKKLWYCYIWLIYTKIKSEFIYTGILRNHSL